MLSIQRPLRGQGLRNTTNMPLRRGIGVALAASLIVATGLTATPARAQKGRPLVPLAKDKAAEINPIDIALERARLRAYPFGKVNPNDYINAATHRDMMQALQTQPGGAISLSRANIGASDGKWVFGGPVFMPPPYQATMGLTNIAGRVNAVAFDNTGRMYAATAGGGVWRYDSSTSTVPVQLSDNKFSFLQTSSIAIHPTNRNIIYVGLGDYDGFDGLGYGLGIMKTTNGGITWTNVGNGHPGTAPPTTTAPTLLEGTAVSAIVINPENPNEVVATTGRGVVNGFIWRSIDGGSNWTNVTPTVPGNWSSISYGTVGPLPGNPTVAGRIYYASCENNGVYRSLDRGATWTKLSPVLSFLTNIKIAASVNPVTPLTAYLIEAGSNDGQILRTLDGGITWTNLTGNFPRTEGTSNNLSQSAYSLFLAPTVVNARVFDPISGNEENPLNPAAQDALIGGARTAALSLGAINVGDGIFGSTFSGTPLIRTELASGLDWTDFGLAQGGSAQTHINQHGFASDPVSGRRLFTIANDGGLSSFSAFDSEYDRPLTPGGAPSFFGNATLGVNSSVDLNGQLGITQFFRASVVETAPGVPRIVGTSQNNGVPIYNNARFPNQWRTFSVAAPGQGGFGLINTGVASDPLNVITGDGLPLGSNATNNPNSVPPGVAPSVMLGGNTLDAVVFDTYNSPASPALAGSTQYLITAGSGGWDGTGGNRIPKRYYYTNDNWAHYQDITPDRYLANFNPNGGIVGPNVVDKNNRFPLYVYNAIDPADASTPTNWLAETRPSIGSAIAFGTAPGLVQAVTTSTAPAQFLNPPASDPCMYTGGTYLWRFDPPSSRAHTPQPGPAAPATQPNRERGTWRRVGTTQLATGGTISAIAVSKINRDRIYVGTTTGELWITSRATQLTLATAPLAPLTADWTKIAGPGTTAALPNRPITAISINTDPPGAQNGDILVSLDGAAGVGHLWRSTNTTNGGTPIFTNVSGQTTGSTQTFASLPDVPVNDVVRDPDDATNTFFVATDLGVFATIDGGSTWSNATAPLGLPNVECTSLNLVTTTVGGVASHHLYVSTYGRGIWQFDLDAANPITAAPNVKISQTFSRTTSEIIVNVTLTNDNSAGTVGTAFNVKLTAATLNINGVITNATSITPPPSSTIGPGQKQIATARFPASIARSGTAATFNASGTLTLPPFPPGTPATFTNAPGVRTRLP